MHLADNWFIVLLLTAYAIFAITMLFVSISEARAR
jgi:hypothetical protein